MKSSHTVNIGLFQSRVPSLKSLILDNLDISSLNQLLGNDPNHPYVSVLMPIVGKDLATHVVYGSLTAVEEMLIVNPQLLLHAATVIAPSGVPVTGTAYELALLAGDNEMAGIIGTYFSRLKDIDGEAERIKQYVTCKPHIDELAAQIASKKPAYDLRPLFDIIQQSSPEDITEALNKNMEHNSVLRDALVAFRKEVSPNGQGMHYKHYTTLMQAFDLLNSRYSKLSVNYDKCDLIWRQIIGYLQLSLPSVDQFAFARGFDDKERTLTCKYASRDSFPAALSGAVHLTTGLGFDFAVLGYGECPGPIDSFHVGGVVGDHMSNKSFKLAELMQPEPEQKSWCVIS